MSELPVLAMIGYDDDDDAVRIANDSRYGLSGMITGGDLDRAKSMAKRIRTGTLGINDAMWLGADAPFGGYKQSGVGRKCGVEGLEIFTETKTVAWPAVGGDTLAGPSQLANEGDPRARRTTRVS